MIQPKAFTPKPDKPTNKLKAWLIDILVGLAKRYAYEYLKHYFLFKYQRVEVQKIVVNRDTVQLMRAEIGIDLYDIESRVKEHMVSRELQYKIDRAKADFMAHLETFIDVDQIKDERTRKFKVRFGLLIAKPSNVGITI